MAPSHYAHLATRYPQLLLPISSGIKDTSLYRDTVLRGIPSSEEPNFFGSSDDALVVEHTPVGEVDAIIFGDRRDFIHAYQALAYRCEPVEIPESIGAVIIQGLINREKINNHRLAYFQSGGSDWQSEFKRFTADKKNYTDSIILLSTGYYSAIEPHAINRDTAEWRRLSLVIRKYHELTHFVMRSKYPSDIDALRDEIIADAVGIYAAFGLYDSQLARCFLGINSGALSPTGRLNHYILQNDTQSAIKRAEALIYKVCSIQHTPENIWEYLDCILKAVRSNLT